MIGMYFKNVSFSFCALIFLIFLFIIFLMKKRVGVKGNSGLLYAIITTLLLIVTEFLIPYFLIYYPNMNYVVILLSYLYDICICAFTSFLLIIIFDNVCNIDENFKLKFYKYRKYLIIILISTIVILACVFKINCEYDYVNNVYNFSGSFKLVTYVYSTIMAILSVVFTAIGRKKISKNVLYILVMSFSYYVFDIIISIVLNVTYHDVSLLYTIIIYALYLTFESQDTILLNEYKYISDESEKAIKEKNDFLFKMSRQIRTPLNTIVGFNELLKNDKNNDYVKYIEDASSGLNATINSLVDISNIKSNNISLKESNYYIEDVFDEINDNVSVTYSNKVILNISYDNVPCYLYGDKEKLLRSIKYIIYSIANDDTINIKVSGNLNIVISGTFTNYNEEYTDIARKLLEVMNGSVEISSNSFTISLNQVVRDNSIVEIVHDDFEFNDLNVLIIGCECSSLRRFKNILDKKTITYDVINNIDNYIENINFNKYKFIFIFPDLLDSSFKDIISFLKKFGMSLPNIILLSSYLSVIDSNIELYNGYIKLPIVSENSVYRVINRLVNKEDK